VSIDGRASFDSAGRFLHTHCVLHDMTERQMLDEERSKAARLESIGILAGGIAHDFNNILAAILGNISLAMEITRHEGSASAELLADAEKSSLRAKGLTQQLLTFSKGGEPVRKPFCIRELLVTTTRFSLRGSNVVCEFDLPGHPCVVEADEGQVNQVINNIVINADQAMPGGGKLSVQLSVTEVADGGAHPLDPGRYVCISIRDNGPGIDRQDLPKIFDPYFTTKLHGSGLGLATCYSIVRKHGGYIGVDSKLNVGTTFNIYLPASDKQPEVEGRPVRAGNHSGRILVMDDESDVRQVASRMLELIGFDVETVANGGDAVAAYAAAWGTEQPFRAVILDLTVPGGKGGLEAIIELRAIHADVKAIVSSGYSNDPVMSDPGRYGFQGIIAKPYRLDDLRRVIDEVLSKS
jgi:nitrogen-specific signal transduction histidine kinase/CheY-like chemotaxis protein